MAFLKVNFFSSVLGMLTEINVILPQRRPGPDGTPLPGGEGPYPVLYLLHGASDNHTIWERRTSVERYVTPHGLAVVMPNAHLSMYSDMAHGGKYYTYISKELPEVIASLLPVSQKREDTFIAGLSMGAAGAFKIGLANPEKYAAIGGFSAGATLFAPRDTPMEQDPGFNHRLKMLFGDRVLTGTEEDPFGKAREILEKNKPIPRIYHATGKDDFILSSSRRTRDFFQSIEGNPFGYQYVEDEGAHTWEYWDAHIQEFLRFLDLPANEEAFSG